MEKGQDACPSCGAQVFPEEAQCPVCGYRLRTNTASRLFVGVAGTVIALAAGAGMWWLLSATAPEHAVPPQQAAEALKPATEAASQPEALPPAAPTQSVPPASTPAPPPEWPQNGASPQQEASEVAPVPTQQGQPAEAPIAVTAEERRAFAKESETNLNRNGLDVTVSTSGEDDTTLVMSFTYPAAATADLIVAGPFLGQCERRGFKRILFVDPGEVSFIYDIATQTLSKR